METDVIVVGAGPAGLMLASELMLAGVSTVVLEKRHTPSTQYRAGGLQPRTAEVLDLRGLLDPIMHCALPRGDIGGHYAGLPVELDCKPWRTRHPYPVAISQGRLEAYLEQRLIDGGTPVLRGHEVTTVEQDSQGVTAGEIRGKYLVACDGGHSTVRRLLGMPFPGTPGKTAAVAADITLASMSAEVSTKSEHFSRYMKSANGFFSVLLPIEGELFRLIFGKLSGERPARDVPVSADEVREALRAVYGPETTLGELREASRFTDATRLVEHYRVGRVFFAGDAAHIHLPIGGQGVNLGIQDAVNLGWKLAATIRGWAPDDLLDSYHTERHPVAARILQSTRAQGVLANPGQDVNVAAVREIFIELLRLPDANRFIAGMISGLDLEYPGVGPRLIDFDVTTQDGPARVSSLMHSGRGLLLSRDKTPGSITGWADRVDHVVAETDEEIDAVLVRPDGYIAWSANEGQSLEAALARWFGHPNGICS